MAAAADADEDELDAEFAGDDGDVAADGGVVAAVLVCDDPIDEDWAGLVMKEVD